jgi:hypothetical protein
MDAIAFGFLFVIGAAIAVWFLRAAGSVARASVSVAQDVTKVVLDKGVDAVATALDLADECKRGGLKLVRVKPRSMSWHWVNEAGEVYGTNEAAVARLRKEAAR